MLSPIPFVRKVVCLPVWGLWSLYKGLWWAFSGDAPREGADADPAKHPSQGQTAAFEMVDSRVGSGDRRAAVPVRTGTLKGGFVATLIASVLVGVGVRTGVTHGSLQETTAVWLWLWATGVAAVISVWAVRHVAHRQAAINARGWKANARATGAGFADMGRSIAGAAVNTRNATSAAGKQAACAWRASCDRVGRVAASVRSKA